MANNDGRVIINIDSNANKVQREFETLDATTSKYNQTLKIRKILLTPQISIEFLWKSIKSQ